MENENWNCICKTRTSNAFDIVKCSFCGKEAHSSCYEIYSPEAKKTFLCFTCRIDHNNPFCEFEHALISPISYYSSDTINKQISFNIPVEAFSTIKDAKTHSVFAVFTKVVYESPKYLEIPPNTTISMIVNHKPLQVFPRRETYLDPFLVAGDNLLEIATSKLPSKCIIGLFYGKKVDCKDIAKKILKFETQPTLEEAKRNFESIRFRELEVLAAFPVRDPITNKMILFAARGSKCRHLQCFDLINYLKFYQTPTEKHWQCFWCKNIVPWRDLRVDQYVYTIIREIKEKYNKDEIEDIENICFDEKGDWKLQQEFSKEWEQNFALNREKRIKEKKDKMEIEVEDYKQSQMTIEPKPLRSELSIEEVKESYDALQRQLGHLLDSEKINESIASKMKELNSFKNFPPNKVYEFFEKTMKLIGCSLPGIFANTDEKIFFYKLEDLAEMVYKKKLSSIVPLVFSWAKSYDELIVITLLIITRNKRNDPDLALAIELMLCFSWFMETRKINFEGVYKQTLYQLFGKLINYFGDKLQWKAQQYATLIVLFKKYIPDLHVPGSIPKKFCEESEKIFSNLSDFMTNMLKGFSMNELLNFLDMVYKPPIDEVLPEEDRILRYVFYYFIQIFKKHEPSLSNEELWNCFRKWDKYKRAIPILEHEGIKVTNITDKL